MWGKFAALLIALDNYSTHVEYNGVTILPHYSTVAYTQYQFLRNGNVGKLRDH